MLLKGKTLHRRFKKWWKIRLMWFERLKCCGFMAAGRQNYIICHAEDKNYEVYGRLSALPRLESYSSCKVGI